MKLIPIYVTILLAFLANEALSKPHHHKHYKLHKNGFCENETLTGGLQRRGGSCSTTIQGKIPSVDKMTSTLITSPANEAELVANKAFSIDVKVINLDTGFFSDPDKKYYADPQIINGDGIVKGHAHIVIQSLDDDQPPNAEKFAFFEGLNEKAKKGVLSVDVVGKDGSKGLSHGKYRICAMTSTFTHQPLIMPVAKRGSQDDCIRINVKKGKKGGKEEHKDKKGGKEEHKDKKEGKEEHKDKTHKAKKEKH